MTYCCRAEWSKQLAGIAVLETSSVFVRILAERGKLGNRVTLSEGYCSKYVKLRAL